LFWILFNHIWGGCYHRFASSQLFSIFVFIFKALLSWTESLLFGILLWESFLLLLWTSRWTSDPRGTLRDVWSDIDGEHLGPIFQLLERTTPEMTRYENL
jgi:hypothetical protein